MKLNADETAAALSGERLTDLAADLNAELEGVRAGSVLEGTEELPVMVIAPDSRRRELSNLRSATVGSGSGGTPLAALGQLSLDPETAVITRWDGQRMNQILAYLEPYTIPAPVLADYQARLEATGFTVPAGYSVVIGGEAENSADAVTDLASVGVPLILVMAGAIMLVFNSFRMMVLILSTGFLSIGLAFFGVWLFNLPMGFNAIVGSLGLLGISINASIVVLSLSEGRSVGDGGRCDPPAGDCRGCHPSHRGDDADHDGRLHPDPSLGRQFLAAAGGGDFRRCGRIGLAVAVFHARDLPDHDLQAGAPPVRLPARHAGDIR